MEAHAHLWRSEASTSDGFESPCEKKEYDLDVNPRSSRGSFTIYFLCLTNDASVKDTVGLESLV